MVFNRVYHVRIFSPELVEPLVVSPKNHWGHRPCRLPMWIAAAKWT